MGSLPIQRSEKTDVPTESSQAGGVPSDLRDSQLFCSLQAFSCLDEAHPDQEGQSALLSVRIPMLISSRNALTDTRRITFDQMSGHPLVQSS